MEGTPKELTSEFIVGVKSSEEKTGCEEATVTFESGTIDKTIALGQVVAGDYNFKQINIDRPLRVKFNNFADCHVEPTYVVLIKDGDVWRQWEPMKEILRKEAEAAGKWLTSWIEYDRHSGQIWSQWSAEDIEFFRTRFAAVSTEAYITVRVAVYIGGSETEGADADWTTLVHTEFKIKFKAPEDVSTCVDN
jgi:hypothetical protein